MSNFDFRLVSEDLRFRYDESKLGYVAWNTLLNELLPFLEDEKNQQAPILRQAFDNFLDGLNDYARQDGACRVFVSHQRKDVNYAERIAFLANQKGFEYWLDVHDPVLTLANNSSLPTAIQSILIAAIIEIALLNCTHVISVQTKNAQSSRWIPYEFGRVKYRSLRSSQVASWFDNQVYVSTNADYLKLGVCAHSEQEVIEWLENQFKQGNCPHAGGQQWPPGAGVPSRLPN